MSEVCSWYTRLDEPLTECEETLVPEYRQLVRLTTMPSLVCVRKSDEVENESVNHFVWQLMLLVHEDSDK